MKRFLVFHLLIFLSACVSSAEWPPKPASLHLGEDTCATCRMIISEEHYGAQLHQQGKKRAEFFDDYGCLLIRKLPETGSRIIYVRSAEHGRWLREDRAFYVVSKEIRSPMGYGIAAFPDQKSAETFARGLAESKTYSSSELSAGAESIVRGRLLHKE